MLIQSHVYQKESSCLCRGLHPDHCLTGSQASALTTMPLQLNKGKLPTTSSSGKGWAVQKKIEMPFKGLNSGGKQGAGLDGMVALGYHGSLYGGGYSIQI